MSHTKNPRQFSILFLLALVSACGVLVAILITMGGLPSEFYDWGADSYLSMRQSPNTWNTSATIGLFLVCVFAIVGIPLGLVDVGRQVYEQSLSIFFCRIWFGATVLSYLLSLITASLVFAAWRIDAIFFFAASIVSSLVMQLLIPVILAALMGMIG